jgi:hypothetical protein
MKWKLPSKTKIYESLGVIVDDRIEVSGNTAKIYSSSRNKFYEVSFDVNKNQIMSNDNSSYWTGDLGYPSIAYLMKIGVLSYDEKIALPLKNTPWKDINQKFKNDFEKALEFILSTKTEQERMRLKELVDSIYEEIKKLNLGYLGKKMPPPKGY